MGLNIREEKTNYEGFTYSGFPEGGFSAPGYAKDIDTKSYPKARTGCSAPSPCSTTRTTT
ncbi:MAG: hypothetical protein ACLVK4_14400 [Alistipes shahii]|uniref:hypothetical protein n=1 Tax=Alistipes shahii TaxID=328814 RepID=UPI00399C5FB7